MNKMFLGSNLASNVISLSDLRLSHGLSIFDCVSFFWALIQPQNGQTRQKTAAVTYLQPQKSLCCEGSCYQRANQEPC